MGHQEAPSRVKAGSNYLCVGLRCWGVDTHLGVTTVALASSPQEEVCPESILFHTPGPASRTVWTFPQCLNSVTQSRGDMRWTKSDPTATRIKPE